MVLIEMEGILELLDFIGNVVRNLLVLELVTMTVVNVGIWQREVDLKGSCRLYYNFVVNFSHGNLYGQKWVGG